MKPLSSEEEVETAEGVFHITCSPNIKADNNSSCVAVAAAHRIIWRSHPPPVAVAPSSTHNKPTWCKSTIRSPTTHMHKHTHTHSSNAHKNDPESSTKGLKEAYIEGVPHLVVFLHCSRGMKYGGGKSWGNSCTISYICTFNKGCCSLQKLD